ncbi:DNA repair and recombination protein [Colletotrichum musicola]|uniref:DNA repair and recombination protein n=1 Tax=Colletotrichum musicola TaxID=2175873 RepID=A0A8H6MPZ7_9PEZI|nr:DNA repair and recombination protein [Colletotrichum musicola]
MPRGSPRGTTESKFDFSSDRRAIIPLNRHRWDLTLHAALAYSAETGRRLSLYLSAHSWDSRIPSAAERVSALLLGDSSDLSVPGMFPYVKGMPEVVNENTYMGLKVVNGAEFTAIDIVHPPGLRQIAISDRVSVFLGPPSGIILQSDATQGITFPYMPPNTIMLPAKGVRLNEARYGKVLRAGSAGKGRFGLFRTGLPCTPGFALTDYKAQGRTISKTLLGLYGRKPTRTTGEPGKCETPLNVAHFMEARMPDELVRGIQRLRGLSKETVARLEQGETNGQGTAASQTPRSD